MAEHVIWTIGHSNRSLDEFLAMLDTAGIRILADVRRFPGSRKHPHFGHDALQDSLAEQKIAYRHLPSLGGRRGRADPDSPNRGWRVESFAAYADYMQTPEFEEGLAELEGLARGQPTAIMCSEALPWRCHRRLVADALIVNGWEVRDIFSPAQIKPHALTEFARVEGTKITYPQSPTEPAG
jgi:uncharacterized protein (DUF488 family)